MNFDIENYFKECGRVLDGALKSSLPGKDIFPPKVHESMAYSLFAGGKRIRPVLVMAGAEACGGSKEEVLPVAVAMEMIHTFSLIHDDLPAMDDDNFRRGVPTNHKVFGEAVAILAGDGLLAQAFIVLGKMRHSSPNPLRLLEVIEDIADGTGSVGMVGGQVVDLESEGKKLTLAELQRLHRLKTGCLITVSVTSGAKCVCEDESKIKALAAYGEAVGLAFQITDDILDIEGGEDLGKDIGSDVENNKATYPSLLGLDGAKKEAQRVYGVALEALSGFGSSADPLRAIARYIVERRK